jgi:hypothetical protein
MVSEFDKLEGETEKFGEQEAEKKLGMGQDQQDQGQYGQDQQDQQDQYGQDQGQQNQGQQGY